MTDETIDCFNCGRSNPEWAQVCRSCGVALRHGETRMVASGRFPTDRDSLISIAAVIGTILAAVVIGLFVSSLNPTDPNVAAEPTPTPTVRPTPTATAVPSESASAAPAATPVPLPGTIAFGDTLAADGSVTEEVETFTPGMNFAYSISMPGGFGAAQFQNEVVRVVDDNQGPTVLPREGVNVDPVATRFGYVIGSASTFINEWGPGEYSWRVYVNDALVATKRFRLAEG